MSLTPRLADVRCTRIAFNPGERILVQLRMPMDLEAKKKLRRTVEKWAGGGVEVLIVDPAEMEVSIERPARLPQRFG
jgi:hypothetical protein